MYKSVFSKISTFLVWLGFLLVISLSSNYFIGCRSFLNCRTLIQAPEEWFFGIPVVYFGVFSYVILLISMGLKIWGSSSQRKFGLHLGLYTLHVATTINLGLLIKLWIEGKPLCTACALSALIYLTLSYLQYKLLEQSSDYHPDKSEGFLFFFSAIGIMMVYSIQYDLVNYESQYIKPLPFEKALPEAQRIRGNPNSKVTVIAFLDLNCFHCKQSFMELQKIYKASHLNLSYGVRYFHKKDLLTQSLSMQLALVSLFMAEQNRYWEFLDRVMDPNQDPVDTPKKLIKIGKKYGIKKTNYLDTVQFHKYHQTIKEDLFLVKNFNISSVPTYFIYVDKKLYMATTKSLKKIFSKKPFKESIKVD